MRTPATFFERMTRAERKSQEIETRHRSISERAMRVAMEFGWLGLQHEELAQRAQAALGVARAELALLEQRAHGAIDSSAARQAQLDQLLHLRSAVAVAAPPSGGEGYGPVWCFSLRRAMGVVLCVGALALLALLAARRQAAWELPALAACLASIWVLGPWPLSRTISAWANCLRLAAARVGRTLRVVRLDAAIYFCEKQIIRSCLREAQADLWVETRLALVRHEIEVASWRAAAAARLLGQQLHQEQTQEVCRGEF